MRLQIDTENKQIHILDRVQLGELLEKLNELFPDGGWKEYDIDVNPIIWTQPSIPYVPTAPLPPWTPNPTPWPDTTQPWTPSWPITFSVTNGVYNVDIQG